MHRLRSSSRKPIHASFPNYYGKIIKNKNVQTAKRETGVRIVETTICLLFSSGLSSKPSK